MEIQRMAVWGLTGFGDFIPRLLNALIDMGATDYSRIIFSLSP